MAVRRALLPAFASLSFENSLALHRKTFAGCVDPVPCGFCRDIGRRGALCWLQPGQPGLIRGSLSGYCSAGFFLCSPYFTAGNCCCRCSKPTFAPMFQNLWSVWIPAVLINATASVLTSMLLFHVVETVTGEKRAKGVSVSAIFSAVIMVGLFMGSAMLSSSGRSAPASGRQRIRRRAGQAGLGHCPMGCADRDPRRRFQTAPGHWFAN